MNGPKGKRPDLPEPVAGLLRIATNLYWTWHQDARQLFRSISLAEWRATRHNPLELLHRVGPERLSQLATDPTFFEHYRRVVDALERYMESRNTWATKHLPGLDRRPIAYFCAEFGLHSSVPIYSGGLGALAGDHCKAASDLGVPLIGVGLMYTKGYFDQRFRLDGWQEDGEEPIEYGLTPLVPVLAQDGGSALAQVRMSGRTVHVGAWRLQVGRVPVFLLDTNLDRNDPADRELSHRLYAGGPELRLRQEWILGVGGVRALRALGYDPGAWHANEGHAAFMLLERLRERVASGATHAEAVEYVRRTSLFTTHTPVPAGHDVFTRAMIKRCTGNLWDDLQLDDRTFFELGRHPDQGHDTFHMTAMAIRLSGAVNGVSKGHGDVSRRMWQGMFPDRAIEDVPIGYVTNGVHALTWMSAQIKRLLEAQIGPNWDERWAEPNMWEQLLALDDAALWQLHINRKSTLLDFIRESARARWRDRRIEPLHLVGSGTLLSAGALTIGFARRFATYKRADLVFRDVDRIRRLLTHPERPVQIIFAGKAHPADDPGKQILQRVFGFGHDHSFEGRIAFLEDYDLHMARRLVQGVDLWLNVPRVPLEACGTSGMKAALNGVPQVGTEDGWWAEGYDGTNGWLIPAAAGGADVDAADAEHLYRLLEQEIVPAFFRRGADGVPTEWVRIMKHAMCVAGRAFSARRMVVEYATRYYGRALESQRDAAIASP